jgi:uncharacterized coiled-coil DUF342 family protein
MAPKAAGGKAKADPKAKAKGDAKKVKKEKTEEDAPKMQEPDKEAHQAALDIVQKKIDDCQKEQQAINGKISERSQGKDEYHRQRAEIKARLDDVQAKMNAFKEQKDAIQGKLGDQKKESADMKAQLNKMKSNVTYSTEAEIDERIASLEFKMWVDTISLKEEKAILAEIKELKKTKPKLAELTLLTDKVKNGGNLDAVTDLRGRQKELSEQMQTLYQQKLSIQEEMKALNDDRDKQVGDIGGDQKKREEVQARIQELIAERTKLKDAFREQMNEYKAWQAEQRRIRNEKYQEERKAQEAAWKLTKMQKEVEKLDVNPHLSQITLIEQTITFCKGLLPQNKAEDKEEKKETTYNNKDGEFVLLSKESRDEEFFFAPTKKKAQKKGKAAGDDTSKKPIKHNAETFKLFDTLGLEAPITVADVSPLLERLEKQIEDCQAKVESWEAQKEEMKQKILEGTSYDDLVKGDQAEKEDEKEEDKEEEKEDENGKEKEADEEEKEEE